MKIEKINDSQIRATITKEDLENRHLKLSELAYGSDGARKLFDEMMEQAFHEYGFAPDGDPIMIEAVPMHQGNLLLIISKVDYPDELEPKFSTFSASNSYDANDLANSDALSHPVSARDVLDMFNKAKSAIEKLTQTDKPDLSELKAASEYVDITKLFIFDRLDDIFNVAQVLKGFYYGHNSLYKNPMTGQYHLVVRKSVHTPEDFNKVCNILAEYGSQSDFNVGSESYYNEHYKCITYGTALRDLSTLA